MLRNLSELAYLINQSTEDIGFTIKEMPKSKDEMVRRLAAGFSATETKVCASILTTAKTATGVFNGPNFDQISGRTDIPLYGIVRGDPISIHLILPPEKLDSHGRHPIRGIKGASGFRNGFRNSFREGSLSAHHLFTEISVSAH